ncbi:GSCFA domain-containing protein [Pseudophaeobacter arcticus]|jgi:hypothetical protein|uniref:GSCFA domain-containing protein n=1 Tax=Pseudophaeobacter arcticus TaxID=385492 RepID=UPI0039E56626
MGNNPYKTLPDSAFWRRSVASVGRDECDPVTSVPFLIEKSDKVATAGSCFAQHIARHLQATGFNYYVEETGHPLLSESILRDFNYGTFSCRYGNIYTARQLLQLFDRAFRTFESSEPIWRYRDSFVDPLRPQIQPNGFVSSDEALFDRAQHLLAVRQMFETMDVFVFTLGLTESWMSRDDGTVFPLCPGVSGGEFSEEKYTFKNWRVSEVIDDLKLFISKLRNINPTVKVILTVSPVPLVATATGKSALSATIYSKSVLRVAAEELSEGNDGVAYFPSYEIITGHHAGNSYFAEDLRSVREEGVSHVMRTFLKWFTHSVDTKSIEDVKAQKTTHSTDTFETEMAQIVKVVCEESALDQD